MNRKVIIATPAHNETVHVGFMDSLIQTIRMSIDKKIDIYPIQVCGDALVQRARNDLIAMAIETNCDDIIFVDSDQQWNPEWIFKLLDYPVDVVGGAVVKKCDIPMFNVKILPTSSVDQSTGLMEIESLGTGFLRISKAAMIAVSNESQEYKDSNKTCKMVFNIEIVDGELISEDNVFCKKWRKLGGKVFVDPTMTCSHIGLKKWEGSFINVFNQLTNKL